MNEQQGYQEKFEKHLETIYNVVLDRLTELGIAGQMPSKGVMRIIQEVSLAFWSAEEVGDLTGPFKIVKKEAHGLPVDGYLLVAEAEDGGSFPIGFVVEDKDAMYIIGHKLIIEDGSGRVISTHGNGSPCEVGCPTCNDPEVMVREADGEFYAYCDSCNAKTETMPDKWQALASWLVGTVGEMLAHAEGGFDFELDDL